MKKEARTQFIRIRATQTEYADLKREAKRRNMTLSKMFRLAVADFISGKRIKPQ